MRGIIEWFDGHSLRGWAVDSPSEPALLDVFVNGQFAYSVTADELRPDVIEAGYTTGPSGFSAFINKDCRLGVPCTVQVRLKSSGEELTNSPFVVPALPLEKTSGPSVESFDDYISTKIEDSNDEAQLYKILPLFLKWAGQAIDRARMLAGRRETDIRALGEAVEAAGGLPGSMGHLIEMLRTRFHPLAFPDVADPVVSVVVPVHNKFELTYDCLSSMLEHLPDRSFEVIVVDDFSSDATLLGQVIFGGSVRMARTPRNLGFLGASNFGASLARGRYLLFLNNDTLMRPGWLDALVDTFESDQQIGAAGSRLLNADGTLQEAGGIVWRDGSGWNWGRGQEANHPVYSRMRDTDYVSGAALMTPSRLFRDLGGFDPLFSPAYYEDTDYCFRVRDSGLRVVVQPASTILHLEGQSHGVDTSGGVKRFQTVNRLKFLNRWRNTLLAHGQSGAEPELEAERGTARRVLFLDDTMLTPDQDAGSNAALQHILTLQRLGYKVIFLPADNMAQIEPQTTNLQKIGVECWYAPFAWSVEDYLRRQARHIDLVYIHRRPNMERYAALCRKYLPRAPVIFSVADLHGLREQREADVLGLGAAEHDRSRQRLEQELSLIEDADSVIVHSTYERELIRERRPAARVCQVPWTIPLPSPGPDHAKRRDLAFIGGFRHPPNVDAVDWFLEHAWPRLSPELPDARFAIIGSFMPERFEALRSDRVDPLGHVPDLDQKLSELRLTVAPLRYGAGLKGKVLASLAAGVPCVMSSVAAEGIGLSGELLQCVVDDPAELKEIILRLYRDAKLWNRFSKAGRELVARLYNADVVTAGLEETVRLAATAHQRRAMA
jgi:O-antigen biosynthesis protein